MSDELFRTLKQPLRSVLNEGMAKTLADEPDHFFYYNNGITILCDRAEKRGSGGTEYLRVSNPQVINGQQTSRMLAADKKRAAQASVLVKVMQVPRQSGAEGQDGFDALVSQIVANTNWQNAINYADLVSNDRIQIEIERGMRKLGYAYLRKRQKKGEARKIFGKTFTLVGKEEIAQAVAACELDPITVREGKNRLFGEHYKDVFPSTDAFFYLTRYWARKQIYYSSRGKPQRGYASWTALHFVWQRLAPLLKKSDAQNRFCQLCLLRDEELCKPMAQAIDIAFMELMQYYGANKGTGDAMLDHSTFFRNKHGRHTEFEKFWKTKATRQDRFTRAVQG